MQYRLLIKTAIALMALAAPSRFAKAATDNPSTTMPATQPATFTIRGVVSMEAGWSLQKPNLSRVAVYLGSTPALDAQTPAIQVEMTQYRKAFDPDFLIVPRGAKVEFPNWDHFYHNVFSRSPAAPPFDLDRFAYGFYKSRQFDTPGVIHIFCNIHPSMHGMIIVVPNGAYARADADGKFEVPPVPPGEYTLVAWHERSGEQRQPVRVSTAGAPAQTSIVLKENRDSILANVPPDHGSGYGIERGLGIKRERLDLPVVEGLHPAPASDKR